MRQQSLGRYDNFGHKSVNFGDGHAPGPPWRRIHPGSRSIHFLIATLVRGQEVPSGEGSYLVSIAAAIVVLVIVLYTLTALFFARGRWFGPRNIDMSLDAGVRHLLDEFLIEFGRRLRWNQESKERLRAAGEEVLLSLAAHDGEEAVGLRRLRVAVHQDKGVAVLEFLAAPQGINFEKQLQLLEEHAGPATDQELPLRLLNHYASSVRHRHYHLNDLLTVRVEGSR